MASLQLIRDRTSKGFDPWAATMAILVHAGLVAMLLQAQTIFVKRRQAHLELVNLSPPRPAPPQEDRTVETPQPVRTPVVAPRPLLKVDAAPILRASSEPSPVVEEASIPPAPAVMAVPSIVTASDLSSQMVAGKAPHYPIESRRKREAGTVVLALTIGIDGRVDSIAISVSSGFSRLDDAALSAVRGWRWRPLVKDGQAVRVRGVVRIPFVIKAD